MFAAPGTTPDTRPGMSTVAIAVLLLLHTPEGVASVSVVVPVKHKLSVPLMADTTGNEFIVIVFVVVAVPHGLVTL